MGKHVDQYFYIYFLDVVWPEYIETHYGTHISIFNAFAKELKDFLFENLVLWAPRRYIIWIIVLSVILITAKTQKHENCSTVTKNCIFSGNIKYF